MDVRCEKCGTEYELDEARLKPGGVTVKCTNCGHMFKIRKRAPTNVGATPPPELTRQRAPSGGVPTRAPSSPAPAPEPARSRAPDSGRVLRDTGGDERLWIIRFDNGEQKTCKELATLQQWIVSGTVTRESMISRTGKTWKRLGDIAELSSFFIVADEARQQRIGRDTGRVTAPVTAQKDAVPEPSKTTDVGVASGPKAKVAAAREEVTQAAVPRSIADVGSRPKLAPKDPVPATTQTGLPPIPSPSAKPAPSAPPPSGNTPLPTKLASLPATPPGATAKPALPTIPATPAARMPPPAAAPPRDVLPSSPPPSRAATPPPVPSGQTPLPVKSAMPVPPSERSTGAWANDKVRPMAGEPSGEWVAADDVQLDAHEEQAGQRGPVAGKIAAIPDEPMFTASSFAQGAGARPSKPPPHALDDAPFAPRPPEPAAPRPIFEDLDSEPIRVARGGGSGKWIALASILVMAAAAAAIYFGVLRNKGNGSGSGAASASGSGSGSASGSGSGSGSVAAAAIDAGAVTPPATPDAQNAEPTADTIAVARDALLADVTGHMDDLQKSLSADESKPGALALEARLITAEAQALDDKSLLESDKKLAAQLHKQAQQKALDAVRFAQRALRAQSGDAAAGVAMADVLRLQGKSAREVERYLQTGLAAKDRDARLVAALLELRDGKREPARADLERLDSGDDAMEKTGDVRARFRRAMVAFAAGDGATARQLANDVITLQPDHQGAKALLARVTDKVASSDPLPPEDHPDAGAPPAGSGSGTGSAGSGAGTGGGTVTPPSGGGGGEGYEAALQKANHLAEDGDCSHAMEYYARALAAKSTSVEALTGEGYCYLDTKQFSSAFSSFRSALAIDSRYERALWGIAEGYQQQGLTQKAIEAYQHYLEVFPDSAAAKKQIEHLGGGGASDSGGSGTGGGGSASGATPPPPPPTPPAGGDGSASGGGSGSGSGSASGNDPFGGN